MSYSVEIRDLTTGELVDRNPVSVKMHEQDAFQAEVERCRLLRDRDSDFEPIVIRLVDRDDTDIEFDREEIA